MVSGLRAKEIKEEAKAKRVAQTVEKLIAEKKLEEEQLVLGETGQSINRFKVTRDAQGKITEVK